MVITATIWPGGATYGDDGLAVELSTRTTDDATLDRPAAGG